MLNFNKTDCYCCGKIRRHPKAKWAGCLKFDKPSCPYTNVPSNNVLAPSHAHTSKKIRNSKKLNGGRWRKVNWRRFRLQQQTKQYQTKVITTSTNNPSTLVVRNGKITNPLATATRSVPKINSNCPNHLNLTWDKIATLSKDELSKYIGEIPITCKTNSSKSTD
jgi:hypothetical protein